MREREKKRKINANSNVKKKLCSLSIVVMFLLTSFTTVFIIAPITVKAGGGGPSQPEPLEKVIGSSDCTDAYLRGKLSAVSYNYGASVHLYVDPTAGQRNRFIMRFVLSSLPSGCNVTSAELNIYDLAHYSIQEDTRYHGIWELSSSWTEGSGATDPPGDDLKTDGASWIWRDDHTSGGNHWVNWATPPLFQDYRDLDNDGWDLDDRIDEITLLHGTSPTLRTFDVTKSVQAFVDVSRANYGWIIDDSNEYDGTESVEYASREYTVDTSKRPHLTIQYYSPPQVQTNASTSEEEMTATLNGYLSYAGASFAKTGFWYSYNDSTPDNDDTNVTSGNTNTQTAFSKAITGLIPGERYYFKAWAVHTTFFRSASGIQSFLTKPNSTMVNDFNATTYDSKQINLTWPNRAGADGAYIEYRTEEPAVQWSPGTGYGIKIDADGYVAGTSFTHTGLTPSTNYWYKAWAYASDGGWTSNGNASAPFGDYPGSKLAVTAAPPGGGSGWILINSEHYYSSCGGEGSLKEALDGNGMWDHSETETHWFILDLGETYMIEKVRGRSNSGCDPISVNIYVSDSTESWGAPVVFKIGTWLDTSDWIEIDTTDKSGRYIKVEIETTESKLNFINFGSSEELFTIFDAQGYLVSPTKRFYFNGGSVVDTWETNYEKMYDGNEDRYASTALSCDVQVLDSNNCTGEDIGPISKVEIRAKGYHLAANNIILRPVFEKGQGNNHEFVCTGAGSWSQWFDITSDTNAPKSWKWEYVTKLCCDVEAKETMSEFTLYCSMVEIQVSYTAVPPNSAPILDMDWGDEPKKHGTTYVIAAEAFDPDGIIKNYSWDLGNGTKISGQYQSSVSVNYKIFGRYTVHLTVTDDDEAETYAEQELTIYHYISVVKNGMNIIGVNYIAWGATNSIRASELADKLGLDPWNKISKFDPFMEGDGWSKYIYTVGGGDDFIIERWDNIQIQVTEPHHGYFGPDDKIVDTRQQEDLNFNHGNEEYNYITWSNSFSITPEDFFRTLDSGRLRGENVEINVYDPSTNTWENYNEMYPAFATLTIINPFDVICFRAPEWFIRYNTDAWL